MLIPAIDLMGGQIVQLVQGEELRIASDDFDYWIDRFRGYPLVQLIDLDAAKRQGDNAPLIARIARELPVQVGGGVRTAAQAQALLQLGVERVIFGSALFPSTGINEVLAREIMDTIGAEQFLASIDTKNGRVAVRGWREETTLTPDDAVAALEPFCGGFLYTHVDTEGTLQGFPLPVAERLRALTKRRLIVAGGIREQAEIDALDRIEVDAVAGMAVYTGLIAT
ncbi:HisA/HisF-related TIM barrel protein [Acidipila sp. EB88]|uniref:1-(5-phosphoribosyl)-5-[(5- phosphoribosylamino)methylideneamino]imidazole-4- carboxamide isomerase n=1 Tax=Acidipila sp. EB88 TaxID=2305226 RepID=UPI000F5FB84A|nr:HisA/HisF-related TIM barrel protein [Acidipila sp. EB88]RRA47854.1 1-(5-phosphoribosyl)-5-[(5-phosphoribosylamino)methylideneamino] imidazole-4-carboxamide isomerase [Acidipila sp. EB88]